jgi:hypothetical protein
MTQQFDNCKLIKAVDALDHIIWSKTLLDMAIECANEDDKQSQDRVSLLLQAFDDIFNRDLRELRQLLKELCSQES